MVFIFPSSCLPVRPPSALPSLFFLFLSLYFSCWREYPLYKQLWHTPLHNHGFYFPFSMSPSTSSFCSSFFGVNIFNLLSIVIPSLGVMELITLKLSRLIVWF